MKTDYNKFPKNHRDNKLTCKTGFGHFHLTEGPCMVFSMKYKKSYNLSELTVRFVPCTITRRT